MDNLEVAKALKSLMAGGPPGKKYEDMILEIKKENEGKPKSKQTNPWAVAWKQFYKDKAKESSSRVADNLSYLGS